MQATLALKLSLLLATAFAGEVKVKECPDNPSNGQELIVNMDGCETSSVDEYCVVKKGETAIGSVQFTPYVSSATLTCEINAVFSGGLILPFPGGCPDPCQQLDAGPNGEFQLCPLEYDLIDPRPFKYDITMEILPEYPSAKLDGEWILYDDTSNVIFCFRIPIDIQN